MVADNVHVHGKLLCAPPNQLCVMAYHRGLPHHFSSFFGYFWDYKQVKPSPDPSIQVYSIFSETAAENMTLVLMKYT